MQAKNVNKKRDTGRSTVLNLFKKEAAIAMRGWNRAGKDLTSYNKICGIFLNVWEMGSLKNAVAGG